MTEVEFIIQPDGSFLIPRGDASQNAILCDMLEGECDIDTLRRFFSISEQSEVLFGEPNLCG